MYWSTTFIFHVIIDHNGKETAVLYTVVDYGALILYYTVVSYSEYIDSHDIYILNDEMPRSRGPLIRSRQLVHEMYDLFVYSDL